MTLAGLAIHAEAWLQEELGAERALLGALTRIEAAARSGSSAELEACGRELTDLLVPAGGRDARRGVLFGKLATSLALPARGVTLAKLCVRLQAAHIDTQRIEILRAELREVATTVVKAGRRLAAMAQYHRGVFEELCQLFQADAPRSSGHLVDARG